MADSVAQLRTDIYSVLTTLDAAGNIGVTHDYERWALHWEKILEVLRDPTDGKIRSWMLAYRGFVPEPTPTSWTTQDPTKGLSISIRRHSWIVRGVLSLDDENESAKTFATTAESVANALDSDVTLHNEDKYWGSPPMEPVEMPTFELRSVAGTLCHVAEISFSVGAIHVGGN